MRQSLVSKRDELRQKKLLQLRALTFRLKALPLGGRKSTCGTPALETKSIPLEMHSFSVLILV